MAMTIANRLKRIASKWGVESKSHTIEDVLEDLENNLPFGKYEEVVVDKVFMPEAMVDEPWFKIKTLPIIGETYTVVFDGVEYELECRISEWNDQHVTLDGNPEQTPFHRLEFYNNDEFEYAVSVFLFNCDGEIHTLEIPGITDEVIKVAIASDEDRYNLVDGKLQDFSDCVVTVDGREIKLSGRDEYEIWFDDYENNAVVWIEPYGEHVSIGYNVINDVYPEQPEYKKHRVKVVKKVVKPLDSKFIGGAEPDAVITVNPEAYGDIEPQYLSLTKGSVAELVAKIEKGENPKIIIDNRFLYGENPCGGFFDAIGVGRNNNTIFIDVIVTKNYYHIAMMSDGSFDVRIASFDTRLLE